MLMMLADTDDADDVDDADENTCEQPKCHQLRRRTSPRRKLEAPKILQLSARIKNLVPNILLCMCY